MGFTLTGAVSCHFQVKWTSPIPEGTIRRHPLRGDAKERRLPSSLSDCNVCYTMANTLPITDLLRRTINESGIPFLTLEQETGVLRQSLMKFARGETSIHLDSADAIATYFRLELRPATFKNATKVTQKRKGK